MNESASGFMKSFQRLIIFQLKLAADALRGFLLSSEQAPTYRQLDSNLTEKSESK